MDNFYFKRFGELERKARRVPVIGALTKLTNGEHSAASSAYQVGRAAMLPVFAVTPEHEVCVECGDLGYVANYRSGLDLDDIPLIDDCPLCYPTVKPDKLSANKPVDAATNVF